MPGQMSASDRLYGPTTRYIMWSGRGDSNTQGVSAPVSKTGLLPFTELRPELKLSLFQENVLTRRLTVRFYKLLFTVSFKFFTTFFTIINTHIKTYRIHVRGDAETLP
jgi:hypothetical protein